jgi:hypothetical protein
VLDTLPDTKENQERRISLLARQSTVFFTLLKGHEYYDLLDRYEPVVLSRREQFCSHRGDMCELMCSEREGWFGVLLRERGGGVSTIGL